MLYFHIKDLDNKLLVEIVKGSVKGGELFNIQTKKLYPEDIQKELSPSIAALIINEQIKAVRSKGHVVSRNTIEMNQLMFNEAALMKFFEVLQNSESFFFNKKKLKIETLKVNLIFKCEISNDTLEVKPFLSLQNLIQLNRCTFFNSYIAITNNSLYLFKEQLEKSWLRVFKQPEILLEKREKKYFLADFEHQIIFEKTKKKQLEPLLFLSDPAGISAKLKFKYENDIFEAFSKMGDHIRDYESEQMLLADLSEAGYKNKNNQNIFYCPQPKIFEALSLLIEIGWSVLSYKSRSVILEKSHHIEVEKSNAELKLNAQISFENNEKIGTEDIFQTCLKKQSFFEIGDKTALIDSSKYQKKMNCFLEEKTITLPIAKISAIKGLDDSLSKNLAKLKETLMRECHFPEVQPDDRFLGKLFNYQKIGLNWLTFLYENRLGAFLADEMGLGKTVQVLAFFSLLRNFCPVLIVAPKSLINNWKSEFKRFLPTAFVQDYYGAGRAVDFNLNSFIITTYGTLKEDLEKFSHIQFECIVLDESSFIKNDKTKANQAVSMLLAKFRICLNGTPIENSINDLISQFNFLMPNLIHAKQPDKQINSLIAPFFLKRTKESVEIDLPEKREQIVYVDMDESQQLEYDKILFEARSTFKSKDEIKVKKMHVFEVLLRLRQICCDPTLIGIEATSAKLEQVLLDIESVVSHHKILVFSQFTKMLQKIKLKLKRHKVLYFDGKTSIREREKMVLDFQNNDDPCIFLMSLKAAGYGLNLQSADYVLIFDPWWNEAVEKQAIDRAHRIGRSRSLIAKKYLTTNTIEEKIYRLKLSKLKTSELFTPQNLNTDDLYYLLH